MYSFHSSFGFRGGKIEKERRRSFSIHKDSIYFNVFSVKNTTQIHKRNFIFVHISNMINQFAQRILHFIVKFYFKFFSLFSPRNFSSAKSKFKPYPTTFSCSIRIIFQYFPPPPKKQHKRSHPDSFVPFNNKQDVSLSRYGDRIDFNTDTWTLPLETRSKLEFTHRVVKSSSNNGYNTSTGADIDLRRPAIQNVSRSRLRVTSRFQTTCGSVSVLRFSFISIIRRTKH